LGKTQACGAAQYYGLTTADNKLAKTEQIKNTKEALQMKSGQHLKEHFDFWGL